jgi:hypothetical protein
MVELTRINPLKAWRLSQRRIDHRTKEAVTWTIADASRAFKVPYQTWMAWELDEGEPNFRRPDAENMKKLFVFTRGQVRPDHFFNLPELRAALAAAEAEGWLPPIGTAPADLRHEVAVAGG